MSAALTTKIPVKDRDGRVIDEKEVATYAGLLARAHEEGLKSIATRLVQVPSPDNGMTAIVEATRAGGGVGDKLEQKKPTSVRGPVGPLGGGGLAAGVANRRRTRPGDDVPVREHHVLATDSLGEFKGRKGLPLETFGQQRVSPLLHLLTSSSGWVPCDEEPVARLRSSPAVREAVSTSRRSAGASGS